MSSGAFEMRARHPRLWRGWRSLITYYGISRREAEVKAASDHRCYEGVVVWKIVRARPKYPIKRREER